MKTKILIVFGTRPEAIKMCPLIIKMLEEPDIDCIVCLTGQHREMLNQIMDYFNIRANYNLDIMLDNQTLNDITIRTLERFEKVIENEHPDMVLVHGDTSTSFACALSCFYHGIKIGHVEAGLRTYNIQSPYPEEFNRQVVDMISDMFFVPTQTAKDNLIKEQKKDSSIYVTGNTVIDALTYTVDDDFNSEDLEWAKGKKLIILTAHRRENIGANMRQMFSAIRRIVEEYSDVCILYPIHKNPIIREIAKEYFDGNERIRIVEPLGVFEFHNYIARSELILTDSGGIQEEAPHFGVPVLVMRDTTERPEGVEAGTVKLIGTEEENIYETIKCMLENRDEYNKMHNAINPYGDGHASERIVCAIKKSFDRANEEH